MLELRSHKTLFCSMRRFNSRLVGSAVPGVVADHIIPWYLLLVFIIQSVVGVVVYVGSHVRISSKVPLTGFARGS